MMTSRLPSAAAILTALMSLTMLNTAGECRAQSTDAGFGRVVAASAGGEELLSQPELWIYETHFKPMRMIRTEVVDPKTGKRSTEWVWYLVFKVINRDLNRPADNSDTAPVNELDPQPPELFMPEFTLVTTDNNRQEIYSDTIHPGVQARIARREKLPLKNPVELVSEVLPITPAGTEDPDKTLYGVAIFRGIDPTTDFFTVYMSGFSNGYRVGRGPNGEELISRKTIVQDFWRPGDEFDQDESEIQFKGDARWIYRIDELEQGETSPLASPADATPAVRQ